MCVSTVKEDGEDRAPERLTGTCRPHGPQRGQQRGAVGFRLKAAVDWAACVFRPQGRPQGQGRSQIRQLNRQGSTVWTAEVEFISHICTYTQPLHTHPLTVSTETQTRSP